MTVASLLNYGFKSVVMPEPDRKIDGVYIGDLLSWVMSSAQCDNAWLTIMSNINVIAVASLVDVSCIILTEGVTLDSDVLKQADLKGINVLTTDKNSYESAKVLSELGL